MELTQTLKDTAYVAIGFGVIGAQKALVLRNDVATQLKAEQDKLSAAVTAQLGDTPAKVQASVAEGKAAVDAQLAGVKTQLEAVKTQVDAQLVTVKAQVAKAIADVETALEPVTKQIEARLDQVEASLPAPAKDAFVQARALALQTQEQFKAVLAA